MAVTVRIPTPLQKLTKNQAEVKSGGGSVKELIDDLEKNFPGLKERICDEDGKVRKFINIYVNEEDIRFLKKEETPLKDGDEVSIIPAIAGGEDVGDCPAKSRAKRGERSRGTIAGGR